MYDGVGKPTPDSLRLESGMILGLAELIPAWHDTRLLQG
jgi:hypothetical protein